MTDTTKIEWCHHTCNAWIGCTKVSSGCAKCYAESIALQYKLAEWGDEGTRRPASETTWTNPAKWNCQAEKAQQRRRVFWNSMSDFFEDRPELVELRQRAFDVFSETPWLDHLLLTKRPGNEALLVPHSWIDEYPSNVWFGISAEDQETLHERVELVPRGAVNTVFLSYEPALGPIDITRYPHSFDWVIIGGESGPGSRPAKLEWFRSIRDQCKAAGVPLFVKQFGKVLGRELDIAHPKGGGEMYLWPESVQDLAIRETP